MEGLELHARPSLQRSRAPSSVESTPSLSPPPADRGLDAWMVLISCFILEALVWGFPFAFGLFQEYYSRHELFSGNDISSIAAIGTTSTGLMYCTSPFVYGLLRRFPNHRKACCVTGFIILLSSLVGASFASTIPQLLATQGVLYAIGGSLQYFPTYLYLNDWFIQRRGTAYGVFIAGGGAAGVVIPFVMEWLLSNWGFRVTLRVWAIVSVVFTAPVFFFLKTRIPGSYASRLPSRSEFKFLQSPVFWLLFIGNVVQSLGYFMPTLYLPSFAVSQGWSRLIGTIALALCSAASIVGATIVGWMVDRYDVTVVLNICAAGTVIAVFIFWSFAVYQPMLYIFSILYGVFAGGFPATWSGCAQAVHRKQPVEPALILSLFTAGKGIGSVISGPLSGALVTSDAWKNRVGYAYGSGYGYLIIFSGITAAFGSIGWVGKKSGLF
ncbi:putative MFS monocarboxylate transporter [Xylogone sp. PMI_703]|nr:putative MFS monocarboxylate transporter [Xylogone sp. PMI_703]